MRSKERPNQGRRFGDTLNEVQLLGYLGADPEVYTTRNGTPCVVLSIRTNNDYVNSEAQVAEWHRIVCWKAVAELAAQFQKGTRVLVKGRLTYFPYPKQTETNHKRAQIEAWAVIPFSKFKSSGGDETTLEEPTSQSDAYETIPESTASGGTSSSDDIPF